MKRGVKRSPVLARSAALAAAATTGVVVTVAVGGGSSAPAAAPPPRLTTATVRLTDLAAHILTGGTLGYAPARPVINQLTGTYTWLPATGQEVRPDHALYRVDDQPVILMAGRIPAWRAFAPGMGSGADVNELQLNLIAAHYADGLLTAPTGYYDGATYDAVLRWQAAHHLPVTGQIALGQVTFLPGPIKVAGLNVPAGGAATPGSAPYQVTTAVRTVTVPVNPQLPPVTVGTQVSIILPSNAPTPGVVTAIGPPPASVGSSSGSGSGSGQGATIDLVVTPVHPAATGTGPDVPVQVALTVQSVRHVLAVPVTALLALAGGGYGLEIVEPSGAHRLVAVIAGLFAGGLVQVSGAGIAPGTKVVVAQ